MTYFGHKITINDMLSLIVGLACTFVGLWFVGVPLIVITLFKIRKRYNIIKQKKLKRLKRKQGIK